MHELSIATSLVEIASEEAARAGAERVSAVYLKLGALSGVVREALEFAFEVATESTMLEGAILHVEDVPVVVFCPECQSKKQLSELHPMFRACCPDCGTPTPDVIQGRELEITALEVHPAGAERQESPGHRDERKEPAAMDPSPTHREA